jgi:GMP synthase (glutamine-hydrolysing)
MDRRGKPILLIKTGGTIEEIRPGSGDLEDWFARDMELDEFLQVDVFRNQELPEPVAAAGIVITGSAAMVSEKEDWSERTAAWLRGAIAQKVPVLGICYGHQLLAHALGGKVGPNPKGRQIGTVATRLLANAAHDPLLGQLPASFPAQTTHQEVVLEVPPGAVRLAASPGDDNFAIRFVDRAWGLQFHPEFSAPVMSEYIQYRSSVLESEGLDPEQLQREVHDTPEARSVLTVFKTLCLTGTA